MTQQHILQEHSQIESTTVQCQSMGIVNEICQTAYNLNSDHNQLNQRNQHRQPKDYIEQTIRWVSLCLLKTIKDI